MLQHSILLTLMTFVTASSPGQIPPNSAIHTGRVVVAPTQVVMVANPFVSSAADSASAVAVGGGMRDKLTRSVSSNWSVLSRRQMNDALVQFGYSPDAILIATTAQKLATALSARVYITSTMQKASGGLYSVTARLVAGREDAGFVVTLVQEAGQNLPDFGGKIADLMMPAIKALPDARNCMDLAETKPDKASEAAQKSLKTVPNFGLAEYCLGVMAQAKDSVSKETEAHFANAIKGDPLSLFSWNQLAIIYQKQADTAKAVDAYQQMLRIAPTNQKLLEEAYKLFRKYGREDAATSVIDNGIANDPANPDWYDLRANLCIAKNDYPCALTALNEMWSLDSSKADEDFFAKVMFVAQSKPDTAALITWGQRGATKFQQNTDILEWWARGLAMEGKGDSAVVIARRIFAADPTATDAVMRVVNNSMIPSGEFAQTLAFAPDIKKSGNDDLKTQYGSVLIQTAMPMLQSDTRNDSLLLQTGEIVLDLQSTNQQIPLYAHYLLSAVLYSQLAPLPNAVRQQKSCDLAKQEDALLTRIEPHVEFIVAGSNEQIAGFGKQVLPLVQSEKTSMAAIMKAVCQ
jgi:tetratricopeptide (TPR) repeat protein